MISSKQQVLSKIYGHGRGWAFSKSDFIENISNENITKALSTLVKENKIRRIDRGIYDYPKYSELLQQNLSSDIDQVAQAYARKFNWRIQVSGDAALNILGLSTQVPGRYIYLSDGPNRKYQILNTTLEFKKSALKETGFKYSLSSLMVQAIKALGKNRITPYVIDEFRSKIDSKMNEKILKDTASSTTWVYEVVKQICKDNA